MSDSIPHAAFCQEADLHDSDIMYGRPLKLGDGAQISYHAANCKRCAFLVRRTLIPVESMDAAMTVIAEAYDI